MLSANDGPAEQITMSCISDQSIVLPRVELDLVYSTLAGLQTVDHTLICDKFSRIFPRIFSWSRQLRVLIFIWSASTICGPLGCCCTSFLFSAATTFFCPLRCTMRCARSLCDQTSIAFTPYLKNDERFLHFKSARL